MKELKETHKTHNIQPQHEHDGTRVSGSFSTWATAAGVRRRVSDCDDEAQ